MTAQAYAAFHTANDRYSGNNRCSGIKSPDRFFHYSGRYLYYFNVIGTLTALTLHALVRLHI